MKIISCSITMVALMATKTQAFTVSSSSSLTSKSPSVLAMHSSYEEQLKAYYNNEGPETAAIEEPSVQVVDAPPPQEVNGSPTTTLRPGSAGLYAPPASVQQQSPPSPRVQAVAPSVPQPVAPPPAPPSYTTPVQQAPPPPQQVVVTSNSEESNNPLGSAGVLFLGLPLWLLLSVQVFMNNPADTAPQITANNQIVIPESISKSAASPSGVVVLSQPITKAEVRGLFDLWNDALKTGDPATVAKRYGRDGVLLPTLSDVPRTDFEGIKDYFVGFLSKKPTGKILSGDIFVGNNWAQDAGT